MRLKVENSQRIALIQKLWGIIFILLKYRVNNSIRLSIGIWTVWYRFQALSKRYIRRRMFHTRLQLITINQWSMGITHCVYHLLSFVWLFLWGPSIHSPCSMSCLCINFYLHHLSGFEPPQPMKVRLYFMNENDSLRFISN